MSEADLDRMEAMGRRWATRGPDRFRVDRPAIRPGAYLIAFGLAVLCWPPILWVGAHLARAI